MRAPNGGVALGLIDGQSAVVQGDGTLGALGGLIAVGPTQYVDCTTPLPGAGVDELQEFLELYEENPPVTARGKLLVHVRVAVGGSVRVGAGSCCRCCLSSGRTARREAPDA